MINREQFILRLAKELEKRNWTQAEFAKRMNIFRSRVCEWLSPTSKILPNLESFAKMCKVLGVSEHYMLYGKEYGED